MNRTHSELAALAAALISSGCVNSSSRSNSESLAETELAMFEQVESTLSRFGRADRWEVRSTLRADNGTHLRVIQFREGRRILDGDAVLHFSTAGALLRIRERMPAFVEIRSTEGPTAPLPRFLDLDGTRVTDVTRVYFAGEPATRYELDHLRTPRIIIVSELDGRVLSSQERRQRAVLTPVEVDGRGEYYTRDVPMTFTEGGPVPHTEVFGPGTLYASVDLNRGWATFGGLRLETPHTLAYGIDQPPLGSGALYTGPLPYPGDVIDAAAPNHPFTADFLSHLDLGTMAADAMFAYSKSWDYLAAAPFFWVGPDGASKRTALMLAAYEDAVCGAGFELNVGPDFPSLMEIGLCFDGPSTEATNFRSLATLDIVGHEYAHGLSDSTANLSHWGESGGLNEGSSDIFGTLIERSATALDAPWDWTIGERAELSFMRYMYKPSLDGHSFDCWPFPPTNDPHYAAGPANRFFYLLSEGATDLSGPTCNGDTDLVPLGPDAAAKVWFDALTQCFLFNSDYCDARICTADVSPDNATRAIVRQAWEAVGVSAAACGQFREVDPHALLIPEAM